MKAKIIARTTRSMFLGGLGCCAVLTSLGADSVVAKPLLQPRLVPTSANNLVPNSSFELGTFGWSSLGEPTGWGGELSALHGTVTQAEKFDGEQSLEVSMGPGITPVTHYDCWPAATVVQHAPLAVNLGWITVEPGATYTLSAYMKADWAGVPARLVVRSGGDVLPRPDISNGEHPVMLTDQWVRYSFTVKATQASVCVGVGPDLRTKPELNAKIWIDAVQFEKNTAPSAYAPRAATEVALESGHYGNVYSVGEPVNLRFIASNRSAQPVNLDVSIRLRDYFDAELPQARQTITVPAQSSFNQEIPLTLPGPGFYRLTATTTAPGLKETTNFPLAVIHEYTRTDSPFGMNHPPTTPELMHQFRRAGMVWGRNWSVDWNEVEPQKGAFRWEEADRQIAYLEKNGWQNLSLLPAFSSTKWASELPQDFVIPPGSWRGLPEWAWLSAKPKDPVNLANYIKQVVNRYKDRIHTWEFLNEPGTSTALPSPFRGMPGYRYEAQDYVDLLKVAAKALKETDPKAKLIGGYSLEVLFRAPHFIRAGGLDLIDILSMHPYGFFEEQPEQFIPQMQQVLSLMDASRAGRKPIWITESGYYAEDDKPWLPWVAPPGHFSATVTMKSERIASDRSIRHALIMLSHGVEKIFYHQGTDGEVNNGLMDLENCFMGPMGTPQKLYAAQSFLAHLLGSDFKYAGLMDKPGQLNGLPTDSIYGYAFQCGKKAVLAAWAPTEWQRGQVWTLKIPRDVEAFNIVGTRLNEGGNGKTVTLGDSVVYLVTELMPATDLANAQLLRVNPQEADALSNPVTTF